MSCAMTPSHQGTKLPIRAPSKTWFAGRASSRNVLDDFNPPGGQGWIAKTKSLVSNIASRLLGKKVSPNPAYDNVVVLENPGLKKHLMPAG